MAYLSRAVARLAAYIRHDREDEAMLRRIEAKRRLGIDLESDRLFYAHMHDPGFIEGVVRFFNETDEKYRKHRAGQE